MKKYILFFLCIALTDVLYGQVKQIRGDRDGNVYIEDSTGKTLQQFSMGKGVVRETFLLKNTTIAVASQADKAIFWDLEKNARVQSLAERIYVFTPDETAFISYVGGKEKSGLFLKETTDGKLKVKLYDGEYGGPAEFAFSRDGRFLAVLFGSAFPLTDSGYPMPKGALHSKYWVELFDLEAGKPVAKFREEGVRIMGQFDESGRYYELKNPYILLNDVPYDAGKRFDTKTGQWEDLYPSKHSQNVLNYGITAEINGTVHTIAQVDVTTYQTYVNTQSGVIGCEIEAKITPTANSPACCLEFWSFIAEDSWPGIGANRCPGVLGVPYTDPPAGGYDYQNNKEDSHPKYNLPGSEKQYEFYDRPSISDTENSGTIRFETSVGTEGVQGNTNTYTIPSANSAFQWGFNWDLANQNVSIITMDFSTISTLNRAQALTNSCFTDWTVDIAQPVNPCTDILKPTMANTANVGSYTNPKKFKLETRIGPPYSGQVIGNLTKSNFTITVDGKNASVSSAIQKKDCYILEIVPPGQAEGITANGVYDLELTCSITSGDYRGNVYRDKEENAVQYNDTSAADIVMVIDRSGSMSGTYIQSARNAASQFVSFMEINDRIGVVSFSSSASVNYPLTPITSPSVITGAQNAIASIFASGSTSIGSGLQIGQAELTNRGDGTHSWALILLSDGFENEAPFVSTVLPTIPDRTDIYSIALGPNSDEPLLQSIASQTGGQYYLAPDGGRLLEIYNLIRGRVSGQSTITTVSSQVEANATQSSPVLIDNTINQATFSLGWLNGGLDLTLTTPGGNAIDPASAASDPDIEYSEGSTFGFYTIQSPQSGNWSINVTENLGSSAPTNFTATVNAETGLTMDPQFYTEDYEIGQPVTLLMSLAEDSTPITGAMVSVLVLPPGGGLEKWHSSNGDLAPKMSDFNGILSDTLMLFDDGAHGDGFADDGVYGNFYLNTQTSGSHIFKFNVSGQTTSGEAFTRTSERSIFIQPNSGFGVISGNVSYQGSQEGQVYIRAWIDNLERTGLPDYLISADSIFELRNLKGGNYSLDAFLDANENGGYDLSEPYGALDSLQVIFGFNRIDSLEIRLLDPVEEIAVSPSPYVPARGHTDITFFGTSLAFREIKIYNKTGRLVKTLEESDGNSMLNWDGTNENGKALASGVYIWIASHSEAESQKGKFAIIR